MQRFVITNFLMAALLLGGWHWRLFDFMAAVPTREWLILGFILVEWGIGLVFAAFGRWRTVFHIANELSVIGFLGCVISFVSAIADIQAVTPDTALVALRGIAFAAVCTAAGALGFYWLRNLAYWVSGEHI